MNNESVDIRTKLTAWAIIHSAHRSLWFCFGSEGIADSGLSTSHQVHGSEATKDSGLSNSPAENLSHDLIEMTRTRRSCALMASTPAKVALSARLEAPTRAIALAVHRLGIRATVITTSPSCPTSSQPKPKASFCSHGSRGQYVLLEKFPEDVLEQDHLRARILLR